MKKLILTLFLTVFSLSIFADGVAIQQPEKEKTQIHLIRETKTIYENHRTLIGTLVISDKKSFIAFNTPITSIQFKGNSGKPQTIKCIYHAYSDEIGYIYLLEYFSKYIDESTDIKILHDSGKIETFEFNYIILEESK